jgi:hypothetical protein
MQAMTSHQDQWIGLFYLLIVFPAWLVGFGSFVYFYFHVAPSALQHWAHEQGYQIAQQRNLGFWESVPLHWHGNCRKFFRVTVRDKAGHAKEGLVMVGRPWSHSISVSRCPVEVRWDGAKLVPSVTSPPENKHPLWDRELA